MSVHPSTPSRDVLCQAIKDVLGLDFDPANDKEVAAAALIVEKLMDDQQSAYELAESIARQCRPAPLDQVSISKQYRNFELNTATLEIAPDDLLEADFPSESSLEAQTKQGSRPSEDVLMAGDSFWSTLLAIDKSYVTVSPETLGFHPSSTKVDWSDDVEGRWQKFLRTAETKVISKADRVRWFRNKVTKKIAGSAKQAAKNYSVLNFEAGEHRSAAHFLFDPNTLYVVIIPHHGVESRFEVAVDDTDNLTQKLVNAFEGHEDYAKFALKSMSKAFAH